VLEQLARDAKYALRMLRRAPGFTAVALLCLSLGIGASTTIFSVVNAVVFKPLPYRDADRLGRLYTEFPTFPNGGLRKFFVSAPEFRELQQYGKAWDQLEAWANSGANLSGGSEPVRVQTAFVTGGMLSMLGVQPQYGRVITPPDDHAGAPLTIVLSHGLWQRSFGGDRSVIGREIYFNSNKATVIGIMPSGFEFPPGLNEPADVWVPMQLTPQNFQRRGGHFLNLVGHLRPGISFEQARHELASLVNEFGQKQSPDFHAMHPATHPVVMFPFRDEVIGNVRKAMLMLLGAVGFFLLIACVNVANLLLARSEARQREIAVRTAVGAGSVHLMRQFLVEGIILSSAGAVLGLALAWGGLRLIQTTNAGLIPRIREATIDTQVLVFALGVSVVTGLVFAMAPIIHLIAQPISDSLRAAAGRSFGSVGANRFRASLVAAELSLALILLIGAGLLVQAFWKLQRVDAGIEPEGVLTMRIALSNASYNDTAKRRQFWVNLSDRLKELPGIQSATLFQGLPPERIAVQNDTAIENFVPREGGPIQNVAFYQTVGDRFFETLGIKLLEGRLFDARDGAGAVPAVVVNQTMAHTFWPGESAIGKRIKPSGSPNQDWLTIVGVVADVKNAGLDKPVGTEIFMPARQFGGAGTVYATIKSAGDPRQHANAVRRIAQEIDPSLPVGAPRTMNEVLSEAQSRPRFLAGMLTLFSTLALALAAFGIYGVISYSVAQRTTEFGIRMALGAQTSHVLGLVIREGAVLAAIGVTAGALGAIALTRSLDGLLFEVSRFDAVTFLFMAAVLAAVTVLASWVPAHRATTVDPVKALKYE
jgi:putative ABC transport system permease protein